MDCWKYHSHYQVVKKYLKCPECGEILKPEPKPPTTSGEGSDAATCYALFEKWLKDMEDQYKEEGNHPENRKSGWSTRQRGRIDTMQAVLCHMKGYNLA